MSPLSRTDFAKRNVRYGYLASIVATVLGFVSRTVFIRELSVTYLGVNGLFANVLGILSFAELGIGSAMNYSLYKPVAENDVKIIRSLMKFYKKAYRIIALAVTVIGLSLLPFLGQVIEIPQGIGNIAGYYVIFLFNNVVGYFAVYKIALVNAEQKNYRISNINTLATVLTVTLQIVALLIFRTYLGYLLVMTLMQVGQQVFLNVYLNRHYRALLTGPADSLTDQQLTPLKRNIGALMWHKIGDIGVYQTDSIIIASFINVATVGLISNYNLVLASVTTLLNVALTSVVSGFGNLIATEPSERQYGIFRIYRFIAFWAYGFSSIALFTLLTPFIILWLGHDFVIAEPVILLIVVNFYMLGHRITINNIKSAAGFWAPDKYLALVQTILNLGVSIALVREIGLIGVYIGTIVQGLLATIVKPILVYRRLFYVRARAYFWDGAKYGAAVALGGAGCWLARVSLLQSTSVTNFMLLTVIVVLLPNLVFFLLFRNSSEFDYVRRMILGRGRR